MLFEKSVLESLKYQALVKLAKENNVYRRYAPKAELVEKLLALNGDQCEKLSDVSAPSDMENDAELYSDLENSSPQQSRKVPDCAPKDSVKGGKKPLSETSMSRTPLVDKVNSRCSRSSLTLGRKPMTPQSTRRSLAGPAKVSHSKLSSQKLECQNAGRERSFHNQPQRLTRQRTFEVQNKTLFKSDSPVRNTGRDEVLSAPSLKRDGTYEVLETKSPASIQLSKEPVLRQTGQGKVAEVACQKFSDATGKRTKNLKKAPDFNSIHTRLFNKMESLVESKQKVIDRANSMQKSQQKILQAVSQRGPANRKVVRKLISPKIGRIKKTPKNDNFKFQSPKNNGNFKFQSSKNTPKNETFKFQSLSSVFSSSVVAIQKRPSVGSVMPGVSKLQSPRRFVAPSNNWSNNGSVVSRFGFNTAPEQSRKEIAKASVMKSVNLSSKTKQKEALKNVRLNKRFELQMQYRLSKQTS